jgi:hypothetical protein
MLLAFLLYYSVPDFIHGFRVGVTGQGPDAVPVPA